MAEQVIGNNNIITIHEILQFFEWVSHYTHSQDNEASSIIMNISELINDYQYRINNYNENDNRIINSINNFNTIKSIMIKNDSNELKIENLQDFFINN
jgi:hypothetical protein